MADNESNRVHLYTHELKKRHFRAIHDKLRNCLLKVKDILPHYVTKVTLFCSLK